MIFDPLYMVILIATAAVGFIASVRVKRVFRRYSDVPIRRGLTGAEVAREILRRSGLHGVRVDRVGGYLSDHYDPRTRTLRLSPAVYDGRSVAAAGVAAHEVGHALQHASAYWPLQIRSWLAPAASIGSNLGLWIVILGIVTASTGLATAGIVLFSLMVAFVLVTLPVELDASARAKRLLPELGLVHGLEGRGVAAVLGAAAMTYVANAVASVAMLIYFVFRSGLVHED